MPLWVHQLAEYLLAALYAEMALHLSGPSRLVLLAAAAVALLVALLTRGPLGLVRVLGAIPHRVVDASLALGLLASPALRMRHVDWLSVAVVELAGLLTVWLVLVTRYRRPARQPAAAAGPGAPGRSVSDAGAALEEVAPPTATPTELASSAGASPAARAAARGAVAAARRAHGATAVGRAIADRAGDRAAQATPVAARGLGRSLGRLSRRTAPAPKPRP